MRPASLSSRRDAPAEQRTLSLLMRMGVHGFGACVLAWPLASPAVAAAAAVGSAGGVLFSGRLARSALRTTVLVLAGLGLLVLLLAARDGALRTGVPMVGPATALELIDGVTFLACAALASAWLRALVLRRPALAIVELALLALGLAEVVAGHRFGAIHRPFEVADPMIARGDDPTWVFLALGAAAVLASVLLLVAERSVLRAGVQVVVVVVVLLLVTGGTRVLGLPSPPPGADGLGLRGDDGARARERGGGGTGDRRNEQLDFQDDYGSSARQAPVGVVLFHDDYSPVTGVYYFRQGAFSQYNGKRLVAAVRADVDRDLGTGFPSTTLPIREPPPEGGHRTSVETTVALLVDDHNRPFALESPVELRAIQNPDSTRFRRIYRAASRSLAVGLDELVGLPVGSRRWGPAEWQHYTASPTDSRYVELAASVIEESLPEDLRADAVARALAITGWLGQVGTYSLRSRHAAAVDPTADFLFGDRVGYCVYFAHAAVYMLRSVGIPSRVATGYAIDEAARQGGSTLLVSGATSHAWPEVFVDDVGWVVFDVTPERILDPPPSPPDADLQRLLGEMLRGEALLPVDGGPPAPSIVEAVERAGFAAGRVAFGLFLAVLVALYLGKVWRQLLPRVVRDDRHPRVAYRASLDRLSELGVRRGEGETREAFAARLEGLLPALTPLTYAHLARAFGGSPAAPSRDVHARLAREVARRFSRWRRLLGWLTPWSWLRTR